MRGHRPAMAHRPSSHRYVRLVRTGHLLVRLRNEQIGVRKADARRRLRRSRHCLRRRQAFDQWYRDVRLPDAVRSFGMHKAWRFWSLTDPAVHQAMYQCDDAIALERAVASEDMKR